MPAIPFSSSSEEIKRRTELLIHYLRLQVGPGDRLLEALVTRQTTPESAAETFPGADDVHQLAERCGLVQRFPAHER